MTLRSYQELECALLTSVTSCLARLSAGRWTRGSCLAAHFGGKLLPGRHCQGGAELQPGSAVVNIKSQTEHNSIIILFNVTAGARAGSTIEECRECASVVAGEDAASVAVMI